MLVSKDGAYPSGVPYRILLKGLVRGRDKEGHYGINYIRQILIAQDLKGRAFIIFVIYE
jgi:hypothetical protein